MTTRLRKGSSRYRLIHQQAVKLPVEALKCRAYGHEWGDQVKSLKDSRTWRVFATCKSCGSTNWRDWNLYGARESGGIDYSTGYRLTETGALVTADRDIIRAVYLDLLPVE